MAAKIGILGENTAVAAATVTVYTVPANKAARVRVLFACESDGDAYDYSIYIGTPGNEIFIHDEDAVPESRDLLSGSIRKAAPDPALSVVMKDRGFQRGIGIIELEHSSANEPWILAPLAADYFLSTGDTVRYTIGLNAVHDHLIQVVGVEDDA